MRLQLRKFSKDLKIKSSLKLLHAVAVCENMLQKISHLRES